MLALVRTRIFMSFIVAFAAILFTTSFGSYPSVFIVGTDVKQTKLERALSAPVHLDDDVMITLRSGYKINEIDFPSYNSTDKAQASTSYISPYLFAVLTKYLKENQAVLLFAILGITAVFISFLTILLNAKSLSNVIVVVSLLAVSTTNLTYSLNGWDHLFQAMFLGIATAIVLKNKISILYLVLVSIFLAFGTLFRPDGIVIAFSIIAVAVLLKENRKKILNILLFLVLPYFIMVAIFLYQNYNFFGYLMPTTARLKIGASPDLYYSIKYILLNGLFNISSISIVAILFSIILFLFFKNKNERIVYIIPLGVAITSVVAFINSDVFSGGRLYWSSTIVLSVFFAIKAEQMLDINFENIKNFIRYSSYYTENSRQLRFGNILTILVLSILSFSIAGNLAKNIKNNIKENAITKSNFYQSPTAQQFIISKWIEKNLDPKDGAIGFYYLGVSYHLPNFEIADFLGKADESIAQLPVRWGPPGHNKWDEDISIKKWNPQVIVPPGKTDASIEGVYEAAKQGMQNKVDYGFGPSLITNKTVEENYRYCYLDNENTGMKDQWGFFLRNDIFLKFQYSLKCTEKRVDESK